MKDKKILKCLIIGLACSLCIQGTGFKAYASDGAVGADVAVGAELKGSLTLNVKGANILDVLSAVGTNLGYSIIYTGGDTSIDLYVENASPKNVFEYVLSSTGMVAVPSGNSIIVGNKDMIKNNFSDCVAYDRFDTFYVETNVIAQKIREIGVPVKIIEIEGNKKSMWVQGLPQEIAKAREILNLLDIEDNNNNRYSKDGRRLASFYLQYISPSEFDRRLRQMGIDRTISFYNKDTDRVYVYGTDEEIKTIDRLRGVLDRDDNFDFFGSTSTIVDGEGNVTTVVNGTEYDTLDIGDIPVKDALALIGACKLSPIDTTSLNHKIFVTGTRTDIDMAKSVLNGAGGSEVKDTFGVARLKHMSAQAAVDILKDAPFAEDVKFYVEKTNSLGEFSDTLYFYCSSDYVPKVKTAVEAIDIASKQTTGETSKSNIPFYYGKEADKVKSVLETLISNIVGTGGSRIGSIDLGTGTGSETILYLQNATTGEVREIDKILDRISGTKNKGISSSSSAASVDSSSSGAGLYTQEEVYKIIDKLEIGSSSSTNKHSYEDNEGIPDKPAKPAEPTEPVAPNPPAEPVDKAEENKETPPATDENKTEKTEGNPLLTGANDEATDETKTNAETNTDTVSVPSAN